MHRQRRLLIAEVHPLKQWWFLTMVEVRTLGTRWPAVQRQGRKENRNAERVLEVERGTAGGDAREVHL